MSWSLQGSPGVSKNVLESPGVVRDLQGYPSSSRTPRGVPRGSSGLSVPVALGPELDWTDWATACTDGPQRACKGGGMQTMIRFAGDDDEEWQPAVQYQWAAPATSLNVDKDAIESLEAEIQRNFENEVEIEAEIQRNRGRDPAAAEDEENAEAAAEDEDEDEDL